MTSVINSKESKKINFFVLSPGSIAMFPINVGSLLEFSSMSPFSFMGPFLSSSPVADEVFVTAVYENVDVVGKEVGNVLLHACHPITE